MKSNANQTVYTQKKFNAKYLKTVKVHSYCFNISRLHFFFVQTLNLDKIVC